MLNVSGDLPTSSWILTPCTEIKLWFLVVRKEIYVEMEHQYLNQIFHHAASHWLR